MSVDKKATDERSRLVNNPPPGYDQQQQQHSQAGPSAPPGGHAQYQSLPLPYAMNGPAYVPHASQQQQQYFAGMPPHGGAGGGDPYAAAVQAADDRAHKRFWSALLWAVGIWLILGLFTGGITMDEVGYRRRGHRHGFERVPDGLPVAVEECQGFKITGSAASNPTYGNTLLESTMHVKLHVEEQDTIYFHSQGGWSHGSLDLLVEETDADKAVIEVIAKYDDENLLDEARVCRVDDGKTKGIEVWTPDRSDHGEYDHSRLSFQITYRLPRDTFNKLNISASIFAIRGTSFKFSDVAARTTNAPIHFDKLASLDAKLSTSNAHIDLGTLKTSTGVLTTSNGAITINDATSDSLTLRSSSGSIHGTYRVSESLQIRTTNSPISIEVDLIDPSHNKDGAAFSHARYNVDVETTNSGAEVTYVSQPLGSSLSSRVQTSNGRAKVTHDREYTGSFEVHTTNGRALVTQVHDDESYRKRWVDLSSPDWRVTNGKIGWQDSKGKKSVSDGKSYVATANAPVELFY